MTEKKVYQLEEVSRELRDMRKNQNEQSAILGEMSKVLASIGEAMKDFKNFSAQQIRHEMKLEELSSNMDEIHEFMNEKKCAVHSLALETIQKSDNSQNDRAFMLFIAIVSIIGSIIVGYLFNKG